MGRRRRFRQWCGDEPVGLFTRDPRRRQRWREIRRPAGPAGPFHSIQTKDQSGKIRSGLLGGMYIQWCFFFCDSIKSRYPRLSSLHKNPKRRRERQNRCQKRFEYRFSYFRGGTLFCPSSGIGLGNDWEKATITNIESGPWMMVRSGGQAPRNVVGLMPSAMDRVWDWDPPRGIFRGFWRCFISGRNAL